MARREDRPPDVQSPRSRGLTAAATPDPPLRVAVAHEWLTGYAGSERVVEQILEEFPGSPLLTTVVEPEAIPELLRSARPSLLQRVPGAVSHHEWFIPLMPFAWALREPVRGVDVVVSSSHACAKAVRIDDGIPHLCYCHTPMRYAWHFEMEAGRFPTTVRPAAWLTARTLRFWDRRTAGNVTRFVANSTAVAERIRHSYGRPAAVVHPPVRTDYFTPAELRSESPTFLSVGRLVSYKRPDLVVEAFRGLPFELVVVGEGHLLSRLRSTAPRNVRFVGAVDDLELRDLYRHARALVFAGEEDFGIAMAEALACGTPVVAVDRGGAVDIVEDGVTGILVGEQTVEAVRAGVERAAATTFDHELIRSRGERFSAERFRREIRAELEQLAAAR